MRTRSIIGIVLVSCLAGGVSVAMDSQRVSPDLSVGMGPVPVSWNKLAMTVELPSPFNQVKLIMRQREKGGETMITSMAITVNDHKITVPKDLLKGLVMASDPEIGYWLKDKKAGKLSSFYIAFEYGIPLKEGTLLCHPSDCGAYRLATFTVDSDYHVTREKDGIVPEGQIHVPPVDKGKR